MRNYDTLQSAILLYHSFLEYHLLPYAAKSERVVMPSLSDLVGTYGLDLEVALGMTRLNAPSLADLSRELTPLYPPSCPLTPEFLALYWSLQLADVHVPKEEYEKAMKGQGADVEALKEELKAREQVLLPLGDALLIRSLRLWPIRQSRSRHSRASGSSLGLPRWSWLRASWSAVSFLVSASRLLTHTWPTALSVCSIRLTPPPSALSSTLSGSSRTLAPSSLPALRLRRLASVASSGPLSPT